MNIKKILFRVSGGRAPKKEIGLGHIFRSINLARELKGNEIHFLIEDFGGVKKIFNNERFQNVKYLRKNIHSKKDIQIIKEYVKNKRIDIVVIDKFRINKNFLKKIKKIVKLVFITDLKNLDYPANILINGFIGYENQIRKNLYGSRCLLGPKYQVLNSKYAIKKNSRKKYDFILTFGGYDEKNIIEQIVDIIQPFLKKLKIRIILGPSDRKSNKMYKLQKKFPKNLYLGPTTDIYNEMQKSRFGICSGGLTSYEFASLRIPFAIICEVNHQLMTAKEWEKKGISINLGIINKKNVNKIEKILELVANGKEPYQFKRSFLVDGNGAKRVASEIVKI